MHSVTKHSGRMLQTGDNDSGRFLKLEPVGQMQTVAEQKRKYQSMSGYDELPDSDQIWEEDPLCPSSLFNSAISHGSSFRIFF